MNERDLIKAGWRYDVLTRSWSKPDRPNNIWVGPTEPERPQTLANENAPEARSVGASGPSHRIQIVMYRCGKQLDTDNKWIAPKAICDGLIQAFELPGDEESLLDYQVKQVRVATRKEIRTEILIEEIL